MKRPRLFSLRRLAVLSCGIVALAFGSLANATPITFTLDLENTTVGFTDIEGFCLGCTPVAVLNPALSDPEPISFDLEEIGEEFVIPNFLTVFVDGFAGTGVAFGEGSATLEANLAFSAPSSAVSSTGTAAGEFSALFAGFFSLTVDQEGSITWETQPGNLVFDDGTEVSIAFGNASDSCSSFLGLGCGLSAQVSATTTLQSVPEPGTLVLLGGGLFGFAAVSRRRRRRAV